VKLTATAEATAQRIAARRAEHINNLQDAAYYVGEAAEYDRNIHEGNEEDIAARVAEILGK
jgi:hypothetical protein